MPNLYIVQILTVIKVSVLKCIISQLLETTNGINLISRLFTQTSYETFKILVLKFIFVFEIAVSPIGLLVDKPTLLANHYLENEKEYLDAELQIWNSRRVLR